MHTARRREEWHHTANVMCLIANCNRGPKQSRFHLEEFLPADLKKATRPRRGLKLTKKSLHMLKPLFQE